MPAIERIDRLQKALLFVKTGEDRYGQATLNPDPIEIDVRWTRGFGVGGFAAIQSTMIVDRFIDIDSVLLIATLEDWQGTGSGFGDSRYMKVVSYRETKDIKARETRRTIKLELYRGTPPPRD